MATKPKSSVVANDSGVADEIEERLSSEVVFAMVGPIGSGVSLAAEYLYQILDGDYKYDVCEILKPSDVIREQVHLVGREAPEMQKTASYINEMQNIGNELRARFGNNYLVEKVVEKIRIFREKKGGYSGDTELPGRRAYIIDSIKNLDELALLRLIYGDLLTVIGVFAPDKVRAARLSDLGFPEVERDKVMDRDQGELATFGQDTRKLFLKSDFFIRNDRTKDDVRSSVERYLDLVFDTAVRTPTRAESAMYKAESASANSACMSRQVGASIVSSNGELIAVGWNDVPKVGGGLYSEDDRKVYDDASQGMIDKDHRCHNWRGGICHNDDNRSRLMDEVAESVSSIPEIDSGLKAKIREKAAETDLKAIIEYSRSIHAEMEAILSVAREGKHSLVGATLFTNTYPCHNCARHIVASGIDEVIYIKPYKKSLALKLHDDAVSELEGDHSNKVVFKQFDGVSPQNYLKLFLPSKDRKSDGVLRPREKSDALPVFRRPLDSQRIYEDKVIADLSVKEQD